jgi:hypothetical protein
MPETSYQPTVACGYTRSIPSLLNHCAASGVDAGGAETWFKSSRIGACENHDVQERLLSPQFSKYETMATSGLTNDIGD